MPLLHALLTCLTHFSLTPRALTPSVLTDILTAARALGHVFPSTPIVETLPWTSTLSSHTDTFLSIMLAVTLPS